MSLSKALDWIEQYEPQQPEVVELLRKNLVARSYTAGVVLLNPGQVCDKFWFLESGIVRFFRFNQKDEDETIYFTTEPYFFTSQFSFVNGVPSAEVIEVSTEAVILELSRELSFEMLKYNSWSTFIRKLVQEVQYYTEQLYVSAKSDSVEDRYLALVGSQPELFQQIPLKHIASYLGVAQPSLSRMRARLMKRGI